MVGDERTSEELVKVLQSLDGLECCLLVEDMTKQLDNDFVHGVVSECESCGHQTHNRFVSARQQIVIRNFISDALRQSTGL